MQRRDRGKTTEIQESFASEPPCRKHPSSSSSTGGICAICLKDRLLTLVCSNCGEPRLSSCSCSDISNRNSLSVDVGSTGGRPISSLIHREAGDRPIPNHAQPVLQRSSSTCLEGRRSSFWSKSLLSKKSDQGIDVGRRSDCSWDNRASHQSFFSNAGEVGVPKIGETKHRASRKTRNQEFFDLNVEMLSSKPRRSFRDSISGPGPGPSIGRVASCRITFNEVTVNEVAPKEEKKGSKVLKWIFRKSDKKSNK